MTEWRAEDTKWGRCEATAKSTGERCGRAATGQHGKCDRHGGKSLKGKEHPNYKHGAFSKFADYDDDVLEAVESTVSEGDVAVLDDLRRERLSQYYTVLNYYAQSEGVQVAQEILDALAEGQEVDKGLIGQLARVMQVSTKSMDNLIARIQSLTNDIADRRGENPRTVAEEHRFDAEQLAELREDLKGAFTE